jgi:DNA-binding NarL/FixJ family response regulator
MGGVRIRVLVADDVPDLRTILRMMLDGDGRFEVVGEAGDGEEAVRMAGELRPDVIVIDVAMPRLDGIQAIPLLHEASPGVRILVLSGFEGTKLAHRAIAACATAFLSKGEIPAKIVSTLHDVYDSPPKKLCPTPA